MMAEDPKTAFDCEVSQGKAIGDACKKNGIKHLVYSGLENVKEVIGISCPHFDGKGIVVKYLDDNKIPNTSTTTSRTSSTFPPKREMTAPTP